MKYLMPLLVILSLISCKKEKPVACINPMPLSYEVNDELDFSSGCSTNGFSYLWSFGDGSTSEVASPKHIYTAPGTYEVELEVFSEKKKASDIITKTITVKARPTFVTITSVELFSFPEFKPNLGMWDAGSNADIRIAVYGTGVTYVDGVEMAPDANFNQFYIFSNDFPIVLPYADTYLVAIIDEDGVTDELVGGVDFDPSKYSLTNPLFIDKTQGGCSIRIRLAWTY